jgi:beta-glucanase (GH16 family)
MKKITLLSIAIVLLTISVKSQTWSMIWNDEFSSMNWGNWTAENWSPGTVNSELQYYNSTQASVSGGYLNITANYTGGQFYSARLNSTTGWTYGRMEASIKLPGGTGTWPAFWMYPDDETIYGWNSTTDYWWPNCGEIDIMEEVGYDPNTIHASVHSAAYYWYLGNQRTGSRTVSDATTAFNVYACDWSSSKIDFYADGVLYFTVNNDNTGWASWPFDHSFHIILNMAVGGSWGAVNGVDYTGWPRTMYVDYVRVYEDISGSTGGTTTTTYYSVPGTVEAENYASMYGIQTEACSDAGGGYDVGWIDAGDWMIYNVNVATAGTYTVSYRVASLSGGGKIQLETAGGATVYGTVSVSSTGGWQTWTTVSHTVTLPAGQQQIAIKAISAGFNLNSISFASSSTSTTVAVTGVSLSSTTASLTVGSTKQLTATIAPTNATNQAVTWSSSNTAYATVSSSGLVTAIAAGTATITVKTTDGSKTATCVVTVTSSTTKKKKSAENSTGNEFSNDNPGVNVYPNPLTNGPLFVDLSALTGLSTIRVFDVNGKLVTEESVMDVQTAEINLDNKSGLFIIQVSNNSQVITRKVSVNR